MERMAGLFVSAFSTAVVTVLAIATGFAWLFFVVPDAVGDVNGFVRLGLAVLAALSVFACARWPRVAIGAVIGFWAVGFFGEASGSIPREWQHWLFAVTVAVSAAIVPLLYLALRKWATLGLSRPEQA